MELQPTLLCTVPRLLNRFYFIIKDQIRKTAKQGMVNDNLIERAVGAKTYYLENYGCHNHYLYDPLVFNKFKQILGGRVRLIVCGSAPILPHFIDFLKISFCCPIIQGYGQTECAGLLFRQQAFLQGEGSNNHVGEVSRAFEFKIVEVPGLKHNGFDRVGEVCYRSKTGF